MNLSTGLTIEDAQYSICKGTYGGKSWSASEKEAACDRYEQLTGKSVSSSESSNYGLVAISAVIIILGFVLAYMFRKKIFHHPYRRKF